MRLERPPKRADHAELPALQTDSSTLGTAITGKLVQDSAIERAQLRSARAARSRCQSGPRMVLPQVHVRTTGRLNSSYSVNGKTRSPTTT